MSERGVSILGVRAWLVPPGGHGAELEPVVTVVGVVLPLLVLVLPLHLLAPAFGECTFHTLTGYPCPTCGVTRGFLALGEGDVLAALRMNPLFFGIALALWAYTPVALVLWLAKLPRPRLGFASRRAGWSWFGAFALALAVNWAFLIADGR